MRLCRVHTYLGGDAIGIIEVLDVTDEELQVPLSHERERMRGGGGIVPSFGSKTVGCCVHHNRVRNCPVWF